MERTDKGKAILLDHNKEQGILKITFNRSEKYNALNGIMFKEITRVLELANNDPQVKVVVLTGSGKYYSSGNDQANFFSSTSNPEEILRDTTTMLNNFVLSFIRLRKVLIAALNGPAIGIAATTLAHCDFVLAAESAWIHTPFTKLGLVPEGTSSVTFPALMGRKASEMLILGKKFTAAEARDAGLINEVLPTLEALEERTKEIASSIASCSAESLLATKKLLKSTEYVKMLENATFRENEELSKRFLSEDVLQNVVSFFSRKNAKL